MLLPIVTALFGIGIASSAIVLLSHGMNVRRLSPAAGDADRPRASASTTRCSSSPGTARASCAARSPEESAVAALNTSGRAVLFAGGTVCIALLGMFTLRPELPQRRGDRRRADRRDHRRRGRHPAARAARRPRHCGCSAAGSAAGWPPTARDAQSRDRRGGPLVGVRRAAPACARPRSRWWSWRCWPSRRSRCGSAPPTRATTRRRPPPARRTTCSPTASAPASTVR